VRNFENVYRSDNSFQPILCGQPADCQDPMTGEQGKASSSTSRKDVKWKSIAAGEIFGDLKQNSESFDGDRYMYNLCMVKLWILLATKQCLHSSWMKADIYFLTKKTFHVESRLCSCRERGRTSSIKIVTTRNSRRPASWSRGGSGPCRNWMSTGPWNVYPAAR
jgi:hypothetical protein